MSQNQAANGNLRERGYRLMVRTEFNQARWVHPIEARIMVGFTDCTDMDYAQMDALLKQDQTQ